MVTRMRFLRRIVVGPGDRPWRGYAPSSSCSRDFNPEAVEPTLSRMPAIQPLSFSEFIGSFAQIFEFQLRSHRGQGGPESSPQEAQFSKPRPRMNGGGDPNALRFMYSSIVRRSVSRFRHCNDARATPMPHYVAMERVRLVNRAHKAGSLC
jgi:hypothetical protein